MIEGGIYKINGKTMRCVRVRQSGINTFQILNSDGTCFVEYEKDSVLIKDHGTRLIKTEAHEVQA